MPDKRFTYAAAWLALPLLWLLQIAPLRAAEPLEVKQAAISSMAVKALRQIAEARNHLRNPDNLAKADIEAARRELNNAQTLLDAIQDTLPTTQVKHRLHLAQTRLESIAPRDVLPDLAPIYADLDALQGHLAMQASWRHLDNARQALETNDKNTAVSELKAAETALIYPEVDTPLNASRQPINQAKAALDQGHIEEADKAMQTAEHSVTFLSVAVREPLLLTRHSLWRATKAYAEGAYGTAKEEVGRAVQHLEKAAATADEKTRKEASELKREAATLQAQLEQKTQASEQTLKGLWQRAASLSERSVERLGAAWRRLRTSNDATKEEFIEAKLYLGYAKVEALDTQRPTTAKAQLKKARDYVERAASVAEAPYTTQIAGLSQQLDQLMAATDATSKPDSQALEQRYDAVLADLRQLIQTL